MFDWINYLNLAEQLNENSPNEAQMRSSISRSYYCVYHKTKILCINTLGIVKTHELHNPNSHKLIYDRLIEQDDEELFEIAKRLDGLKFRRKEADYDATFVVKHPHVVDTILKSKAIIELIKNYNI